MVPSLDGRRPMSIAMDANITPIIPVKRKMIPRREMKIIKFILAYLSPSLPNFRAKTLAIFKVTKKEMREDKPTVKRSNMNSEGGSKKRFHFCQFSKFHTISIAKLLGLRRRYKERR